MIKVISVQRRWRDLLTMVVPDNNNSNLLRKVLHFSLWHKVRIFFLKYKTLGVLSVGKNH